jgi:hypothetical protein
LPSDKFGLSNVHFAEPRTQSIAIRDGCISAVSPPALVTLHRHFTRRL